MLRRPRTGLNSRLIASLVALALILTIWQHHARLSAGDDATQASLPELMASRLTWPLQKLFSVLGSALYNTGLAVAHSGSLARENTRLRARVEELETQKLSLNDAYFENQRLKKTLGFGVDRPPQAVPARVVAVNFGLSRKRLTVAAPPGRELEVGNIVRTSAGLVGRVIDAAGNRGEVFPLLDAEHAVSAVDLRSRDQGMVRISSETGGRPEQLVMEKVVGRCDIREGDVIMTSGLGEVYPAGIPIGVVEFVGRSTTGAVDFYAIIRPFADFDHLEYVLVERHGK